MTLVNEGSPEPAPALAGAGWRAVARHLVAAGEALAESAEHCTAGCRVEVLEGCGHFLHRERPDEVNRLILDFIGTALPTCGG